MNANELADEIEKDPMRWTILESAIAILRQQQAEIEILKNALKNCADLIKKAQEK